MKIFRFSALFVFLTLTSFASVYADCEMPKGECPKSAGQCAMHEQDCEAGECPIVSAFCKSSRQILANREELALTDDQLAEIQHLKLQVQKNSIQQKAGMEIFQLELGSLLAQPKPDVEAINAVVDKASADFSASTKENIAAYAKLKGLLTDEQAGKLKELSAGKMGPRKSSA